MNTAIQFHYNQLGNIIVATKVVLTFRFLWSNVIGQAIFNVMCLHKYFVSFLYKHLLLVG